MGVLPACQCGLFADLCGKELPIRYLSRLAPRPRSGDRGMVGLPSYHHTLLVAQEAGLTLEALRDNFSENYGKAKILKIKLFLFIQKLVLEM